MSDQRVLFLRKGFVGTCALTALVLLASFYAIVSGAVDRAVRQRSVASEGASGSSIPAIASQQPRGTALLSRIGH
ncbi:MAG: hypothetical protein ABIQ33_05615 [Caldimonas sp.]